MNSKWRPPGGGLFWGSFFFLNYRYQRLHTQNLNDSGIKIDLNSYTTAVCPYFWSNTRRPRANVSAAFTPANSDLLVSITKCWYSNTYKKRTMTTEFWTRGCLMQHASIPENSCNLMQHDNISNS